MANTKISDLSDGGIIEIDDYLVIVRGGANYKVKAASLFPVVVTSNETVVRNSFYVCNGASQLDITMPATSEVDDRFAIISHNEFGFKLIQNAGQQIHINDTETTLGATGYLEAKSENGVTAKGAGVEMICVVANTTWRVIDIDGYIFSN